MTEALYEQCSDELHAGAIRIEEELEGLGPASIYFVDLDRFALDPAPRRGRPCPADLARRWASGCAAFPPCSAWGGPAAPR
jgi:hypothetical protein